LKKKGEKKMSNFKGSFTETISRPIVENSLENHEYINPDVFPETKQIIYQGIDPKPSTLLQKKEENPKTLNILFLGGVFLLSSIGITKIFTVFLQNKVNDNSLVKKNLQFLKKKKSHNYFVFFANKNLIIFLLAIG
jgi:hypothetical protein